MGLETGQMLAQRYEIIRRLGCGGSASVYLVYDTVGKRRRALKEVSKSPGSRGYGLALREAEIVRKLKYPYFPEIFDILEWDGAGYIVMEYLQGETAGERLRRLGPQPVQEVLRWGGDLCLMLSYLHRCIPPMVYCDIKPDNIMIQSGGNIRLIDFGAVSEAEEEGGSPRLILGTKGYAAPEQFGGDKPIDARTDIYGLGVTMHQLLTGQDPCRAQEEGFLERYPGRYPVARRLARIIRKCIQQEPKMRYQTCEELREDLRKAAK